MKKKKRENLNLFFSAFLVLGYIVCTYFFMTLAQGLESVPQMLITIAVFFVFGLLLFYATRVGDGEPIKRFSPIVLIVLDIPCLYIILAHNIPVLPLHDQIVQASAIFIFACIALGYGIPYTFLSGFEIRADEEGTDEEKAPIEGGIKEELLEVDDRDMDEPGLIDREKGSFIVNETADGDAQKQETKEDTSADPSELQPVEDRDMDEPGLIGNEEDSFTADETSDEDAQKQEIKEGTPADPSELQPVEDRDMDEPGLIGNDNEDAPENDDTSKLEKVEQRDMDEPGVFYGEEN